MQVWILIILINGGFPTIQEIYGESNCTDAQAWVNTFEGVNAMCFQIGAP